MAGGQVSETRVERGAVADFGILARSTKGAFRGPLEHCKLHSQVKCTAVKSTFWVGGKWIMEIPVYNALRRSSGRARTVLSLAVRTHAQRKHYTLQERAKKC